MINKFEPGSRKMKMTLNTLRRYSICILLYISLLLTGCEQTEANQDTGASVEAEMAQVESVEEISEVPDYSGDPFVTINDNVPEFEESDLTTESFEEYSELDELGRCGTAYANIGEETMPTEKRGAIGMVKPSGWHTVKYDCIADRYLYNRCHLIGYQLSGENANEENLITGTRYMNVEGMLPFENLVAEYVEETGNHVLYRVTPIFEGNNLVADGVQMEALSVEDDGEGVEFNVFCYNIQPYIEINYATGESCESDEVQDEATSQEQTTYIVNTNTRKFHRPDCSSVADMKAKNRKEFTGTREELTAQGYEACGRCNP